MAPKYKTTLIIMTTTFGWCVAASLSAAAPHWQLENVPSAVFAARDQAWRVGLTGDIPGDAVLAWGLTINDRTIARGESRWSPQDDGSLQAAVAWRTPAVKDGAIISVQCTLSVTSANRSLAETSFVAWVFPQDPFAHRREWLKARNVVVFAPDAKSAPSVERTEFPGRRIASMTAIERLTSEVLIVSELVSGEKNRELPAKVEDFVTRGGRCLWLSPPPGLIFFGPRAANPAATHDAWERIALRRQSVIVDLDKRLDARVWAPSADDHTRLTLAVHRMANGSSVVVGEATTALGAWPWIEAESTTGGRLILCGYPLLNQWDRGPTPRYLLARILESFELTTIP